MKISLLITNHNYSKWLRRAINSALNQTFPAKDFEILVVDDASSDQSHRILDGYRDAYRDRIRVLPLLVNHGLGAAANTGLNAARGMWFIRLDADDYLSPEALECLYAWASRNPDTMAVSCDYTKVDLKGRNLSRHNSLEEPIACGVLFRTDLLHAVGGYNDEKRIHEDRDLLARWIKEYKAPPDRLAVPLYRYFQHPNQMTKNE